MPVTGHGGTQTPGHQGKATHVQEKFQEELAGWRGGAIATVVGASELTPAAAQEPVNWAGPYIGGHVAHGIAWYDGGFELAGTAPFFADDFDLSGLGAGVHGGFNWQFDSIFGDTHDLIVGIEGNATFFDISDSFAGSDDGISAELDILASVRARLGVAFDRMLVFVTGGIAISDATYTVVDDFAVADTADFNNIGGVFGGGVEFALSEMVSLRGEGLYYIFDDRHSTSFSSGAFADFAEFDDAFAISFGVTIHLGALANGGGP